ncbi:hypothetical protein HRbin01_01613 [archaeon HR01]|nr:hypothetical protein HRbin01_01613 [archaeon HR01]
MIWAREMLKIYSFYRGNGDGELLRDHVSEALRYAADFNDSKLVRMITSLRGGEKFIQLLTLSIILHDAGKVFLQDNRKKDRLGVEYISFAGHEFLSALLTKLLMDEVLLDENFPEARVPVFAVYYHHHAMNPLTRKRFLQPAVQAAQKNLDLAQAVYEVLGDFLPYEYRGRLCEALEKFHKILNVEYIESSVKAMIDDELVKRADPHLFKLALTTLDALIVCDYLAASKRSEKAPSAFSSAVSMFHKIWTAKI